MLSILLPSISTVFYEISPEPRQAVCFLRFISRSPQVAASSVSAQMDMIPRDLCRQLHSAFLEDATVFRANRETEGWTCERQVGHAAQALALRAGW
jgi:hypothetical protein